VAENEPREAAEKIDSTFPSPNHVKTDDGGKNQKHCHHIKHHQNTTLQLNTQ